MGLRVREGGGSERRPVMGRIGIEPKGDITPRESEQTSDWSLVTRELGKPAKEAMQMTANLVVSVHETVAPRWVRCSFPRQDGLAPGRLASGPPKRAPAPSAYREGDTGCYRVQ